MYISIEHKGTQVRYSVGKARHLVSWAKGGWAEDQGGWAKVDDNAQQKWTIMLQVKGNIVQKYHIKSI